MSENSSPAIVASDPLILVGSEVFPGLHLGDRRARAELGFHVTRLMRSSTSEDTPSGATAECPRNPWIVLSLVTPKERQQCGPLPSNTIEHTLEYRASDTHKLSKEIYEKSIELYRHAQKRGKRLLIQCEDYKTRGASLVLAIMVAVTGLPLIDVMAAVWETLPEMLIDADARDHIASAFVGPSL